MRRLLCSLSRIIMSSTTRPMNTPTASPEGLPCGGGLPAAASCQGICARLGLNPKGLTMENSIPSQSLVRLPRKHEREAGLVSGHI